MPADHWERLLAAGLPRDFEQLRIDFLNRTRGEDPDESVERWVERNPKRIAQFRALIERAKLAGAVTAPMLAQIASQARILLSALMRVAILRPGARIIREAWDWAYDVEAAALRRAGIEVEPRPWTEPGDLAGFDLVLPLVAWGYHLRSAEWLALLDRLEARAGADAQPAAAAALEQRQALSRRAWRQGRRRQSRRALVEALDEAALAEARARFGDELVIKPPVSAAADGTSPARPGRPAARQRRAAGR